MKKITYSISVLAMLLVLGAALPASAQSVGINASSTVRVGGRGFRAGLNASSTMRMRMGNGSSTNPTVIANAKAKGDKEVAARVAALNKLATRVSSMKNLSASEKASFSTEIQTQITNITTLQAKIDADTDTATLKTDMKSITDAYRIYALVVPQVSLLSAADRVGTLVSDFTTLAAKLQTRITNAQSAGKDTSALVSALADLNAKVSDANTQATAATNGVVSLAPDNGNTTIAASNKAALVASRADIKTATADLKAAQKDSQTIIAGTKGVKANAGATVSASSTTSTGTTTQN